MHYQYIVRRYELARKMAADHHKGKAYKLSELDRVWFPAAESAIEYMAKGLKEVIHLTDMPKSEIETYLYNNGFIKIKPEIKL